MYEESVAVKKLYIAARTVDEEYGCFANLGKPGVQSVFWKIGSIFFMVIKISMSQRNTDGYIPDDEDFRSYPPEARSSHHDLEPALNI